MVEVPEPIKSPEAFRIKLSPQCAYELVLDRQRQIEGLMGAVCVPEPIDEPGSYSGKADVDYNGVDMDEYLNFSK